MPYRLSAALVAFFVVFSSAAWGGERGYFGFSLTLDVEGAFWNPTLRSVKIDKVTPRSSAALAGIIAGDELVEVAGRAVVGAKGRDIQAHIDKDIGQTLQMKLKHPGGETFVVTLTAAARIKSP